VIYISIEMLKMTTIQAEMPLGFMLVGLGRLGFPKHVIARHEASLPLQKQGKQSQVGQKKKKHSVSGRQEFLKAEC